ncbi:cell surface protein [Pseudobacillus badius]|uniref:cell surface protein n=1 Tax=Bacillus badius TaxID=1455 RepID=UPI003D349CBA
MKMNRRLLLVSVSTLSLFGLWGCSTSTNNAEIKVAPLHASYAIDVNDINEVVGDADNVFVGYVEKLKGTEYKFPVTKETEDGGTKELSMPYTNYSITVVDNIKGKLKKNKPIPMQKTGGQSEEDKNLYLVYEKDNLPKERKYYIFNTYNQPDGTILIPGGPNSSIELNAARKSEIVSSKKYKEFKKAVRNQVKSDRKRFESKYNEL